MQHEEVLSLDYTPRPWQEKFHLGSEGKRSSVAIAGRQIGKTHLAIAELVSRAISADDNSNFAYIAPSMVQARRIAWVRLKDYLSPFGKYTSVSETQLKITLPGNKSIYLLGLDNENIRGLSLKGIVADEYDSMDMDRWNSVVLPTQLNHKDAWIIFIGTLSNGTSRLWKLYQDHIDNPDWHVQVTKASDTGLLRRRVRALQNSNG